MNTTRMICLWCIGLCVLTTSLYAADDDDLNNPLKPKAPPSRILLGPIFGFNKDFHTGGFRSFVSDLSCPVFGTGDASGFYAGGSFEYLIGEPKDANTSIIARLAYDTRPASFKVTGDKQPSRVRLPSGELLEPIETTTEHTAEIKFTMINLDLLFKYMIGHTRIGVIAGPAIGYGLNGSVEQKFQLVDHPEVGFDVNPAWIAQGYQYSADNRTITIRNGDIPDFQRIRIGMNVGLQYEFSVSRALIVPMVMYDFGITKLTSTENWRVNALQAGVDVRFLL